MRFLGAPTSVFEKMPLIFQARLCSLYRYIVNRRKMSFLLPDPSSLDPPHFVHQQRRERDGIMAVYGSDRLSFYVPELGFSFSIWLRLCHSVLSS